MHNRIFRQNSGKSKSSSTPAPNPFQSRPFAPAPEVLPQPQETPDLERLKQKALQKKGSGYNFANVNVTPRQTNPLPMLQRKLAIGEPGDKYEQEADQVASQVVQQINTPSAAQSTQGQSLQRQEAVEEEIQTKPSISVLQRSPLPTQVQLEAMPDEELQAKSILQGRDARGGGEAPTDVESAINSARGGGMPLDSGLQQLMGQAMGADFSGVKVHTDTQADQLNKSIQAKAFTTGQDVFFRQGEYNPGSRGGQELIAHELTHVVQQNGGTVQRGVIQRATFQLTDNQARDARAGKRAAIRSLEYVIAQLEDGSAKDLASQYLGVSTDRQLGILAQRYRDILKFLQNFNGFMYDDDNDGAFGWTRYKDPHIYLQDAYFTSPLYGANSMSGIIIHEATHNVLNTEDYAYGEIAARALARAENKQKAKENADNMEFLIEQQY